MTTTQRLAEIKDIHKARGRLPSVMEQVISDLSWLIARVEELDRELERLRNTNRRLNARCQSAERAVADAAKYMRPDSFKGGSIGRAFLAHHAAMLEARISELEAAHCSQAHGATTTREAARTTDAG